MTAQGITCVYSDTALLASNASYIQPNDVDVEFHNFQRRIYTLNITLIKKVRKDKVLEFYKILVSAVRSGGDKTIKFRDRTAEVLFGSLQNTT